MTMRIRYSDGASSYISRLWERDEGLYHSLQALVVLLSTDPSIDNDRKVLHDFGSGNPTPVYVGRDWGIVYRMAISEEILEIISIWDAKNPPGTRL